MIRFALALVLVSLAFLSTIAQKKTVKQVQVSAETISRQPDQKPYTVDVTREGTVYVIAADVDYSRVSIKTSKGAESLSEMARRAKRSGRLLIGKGSDIHFEDVHMNIAERRTSYSCDDTSCKCTGVNDCYLLGWTHKCKGGWTCDENGCTCFKE